MLVFLLPIYLLCPFCRKYMNGDGASVVPNWSRNLGITMTKLTMTAHSGNLTLSRLEMF